MPDAILVLYPPSFPGLSCTLKCEPVPGRVVRVLVLPRVVPSLAVIKMFALVGCYVCVLVSLCAYRQKVDSAFSKIRIKQLKHHIILIPISQNLHMASRSGTRSSRNRTPAAAEAGVQPNGQNPPQEE